MTNKVISLNKNCDYSCIIPANSHEVKKSLKEAVLVSGNTNLLRAHFVSTAYGIKVLALSFFNAFAYFFLGVYHFTKEIFHCSCKEAFTRLGSNLADSLKSLCAAILGVAVVAVGFFFPHKIYSLFAEGKKELASSTSIPQKISQKKETSTITINQKTEKKKEDTLPLKHQTTKQAETTAHPSLKPEQKKQTASVASKSSYNHFSCLPTVLTTLIDSFLDKRSQNSFAAVSKDLAQQARKRRTNLIIDDSFGWDKIRSPEDLVEKFKDQSQITILDIRGKATTKENLALLASVIKKCFPNLKQIYFSPDVSIFSKEQFELLPLIEQCPNIEKFSLFTCGDISYSWEILQALSIHCKFLKSLNLDDFQSITPEQLEIVLKNLPHLKELIINTNFKDEHLALISKYSPELENLFFFFNDAFTEQGLAAFAKIKNYLKKISLFGSVQKLSPIILKDLFKNSPLLKKFYSCNFPWSNDKFNSLAHLPSSLRTLNLDLGTKVSDAGFAEFPILPELRNLTLKNTYGPGLTDATILRLAEKCPNLRYISLWFFHAGHGHQPISENAFIQWISKYPHLEYLDLTLMDNLSDEMLKAIAKLPNLRFLKLSHSGNFTKQGIEHLKKCENLRYLDLLKTKFSDGFAPTNENIRSLVPQLIGIVLSNNNDYLPPYSTE